MLLFSHFLPLFIILVGSPTGFSSFKQDPLSLYLVENNHDPRAYPLLSDTVGGQDGKLEHSLNRQLMSYKSNVFDFTRFNRLRSLLSSPKVVSVDQFGAKGDGSDATEAFMKAWKEACSSREAILLVPKGRRYLLKPITFTGPCKSDLTMKIYGTIEASIDQSVYATDLRHWIVFDNVRNFKVEGSGTINGNGATWWKRSCKIDKSQPCKGAPTAVTFYQCNNLIVDGIKITNAQQMHVVFQKCVNVRASNLIVTAPEKSPNTDGIHVTDTQNIQIISSTIRTGDDCISIVSGSESVQAMDITCGPGHGISIGSLGSGNSAAYVSDVTVNRAKLSGTTNGVRIKTWQGGSGYAKNIKFQNIEMHNVTNPIIIDQNYCDQEKPCQQQASAVQVRDIVYKNIAGTSNSGVAVKFDCSRTSPCQGIILQDINIVGEDAGKAKASCLNVKTVNRGRVSPQCN